MAARCERHLEAPCDIRGAPGAWAAADRLVRRLGRELQAARAECARLRSALNRQVGEDEDGTVAEAARREALARPSLVARLRGEPECGATRLVRNVSLHAKRCPEAGAPLSEWKAAQREGRLPGGAAAAAAVQGVVENCDGEVEGDREGNAEQKGEQGQRALALSSGGWEAKLEPDITSYTEWLESGGNVVHVAELEAMLLSMADVAHDEEAEPIEASKDVVDVGSEVGSESEMIAEGHLAGSRCLAAA